MTMDKRRLLSLATLLALCACAATAPASPRQKSLLGLLGFLEKLTSYSHARPGTHAQGESVPASVSESRDQAASRPSDPLLPSTLEEAAMGDDGGRNKRQGGWWTYDYGLGGGRFGKRNFGEYGIGGGRYGRDVDHVDVASSF